VVWVISDPDLEPDLAHARVNKIKVAGYPVGYINFAPLLVGAAVVDTYKYKLAVAGIYQANQRTEGQVRVGRRQGFGREHLAIGGFAPIEPGSIPTGIAGPGLNRLNRLA